MTVVAVLGMFVAATVAYWLGREAGRRVPPPTPRSPLEPGGTVRIVRGNERAFDWETDG